MHGKPALQWWLPGTIAGKPSAEETTAEGPSEEAGLMARVVERHNLLRALTQVQSHGGSPGLDGMTVAALAPSRKAHGLRLTPALWEGSDQPPPVKRIEVPKPPGGGSQLGVPTVVDRCLQHAVRPGLQAPWEPTCAEARVGFRLGRHAPQAGKRAQASLQEGNTGGVAMDWEQVVDRVNHDQVMSEVSKRVHEGRVLPLSHRVLKAGAMAHEARPEPGGGVSHGGPRSP